MDWALIAGLAVTVIALEGVLLYLLLRQHGLLLLRFDALNHRLDTIEQSSAGSRRDRQPLPSQRAPVPLPAGETAPAFALPGLDGRERRLRDYVGEPLVVLFFNPQCGFCTDMASALGQLSQDAHPLLLVSRGDPEENKRLAAEHAWRCDVVLDPRAQVANAYRTQATPTGYLLDREGRIASPLAIGADALLTLLESTPSNGASHTAHRQTIAQETDKTRLRTRPISESRINRNGLLAGTPAPSFDLPDLNGQIRSLNDFRGRRVLLVLSDPNCGPCQELVPSLTHLHQQSRHDIQILMVSKGKLELNQQKVREHSVQFPVLLQRGAEIAKKYGIFATPVGYLIDEHGTLATDVAIGKEAILQIAAA
jgi:peroxiredoxin